MKRIKVFCHCAMVYVGLIIAGGCANNVEEPLIDCSLSDLSVTVENQIKSDCNVPGSITVVASGGTEPYAFSIDGLSFQTSNTINDLFAGEYTVQVRDFNNCIASVATTLEAEEGSVSFSLETTSASCGTSTGTITVSASGGVEPFEYSLNNGPFQTSNQFLEVSNGPNTVTLRDSEGCSVTKTESLSSGVSLSDDVMPILNTNCAVTGCHNGSRSPDMRTKEGIIGSASRIKARTSAGTMPPFGRPDLTAAQIETIACWVDDGALNN